MAARLRVPLTAARLPYGMRVQKSTRAISHRTRGLRPCAAADTDSCLGSLSGGVREFRGGYRHGQRIPAISFRNDSLVATIIEPG